MAITAQYDREADALYIRLADRERTRTVEVDDATYVDVDDNGLAVGIEFLYPAHGVALQEVARRFSLLEQQSLIIQAIADAGAPVVMPTITSGQYIASTTTMNQAIEGTVHAAVFHGAIVGMPGTVTVRDDAAVTVGEAELITA